MTEGIQARVDRHEADTILFIDDEDLVRSVGRRMLEKMGYIVLTASDGLEGVAVFRKHRDVIICVVLDLSMPRMGGKQAFEEIRKISGRIPVIMSSGYTEYEVSTKFTGEEHIAFIQKPYKTQDMVDRIVALVETATPTGLLVQ